MLVTLYASKWNCEEGTENKVSQLWTCTWISTNSPHLLFLGESGPMLEDTEQGAFLNALDNPQLRMRIANQGSKTLEDTYVKAMSMEANTM